MILRYLLILALCLPALVWGKDSIVRDEVNQFPRCLETKSGNYFFKWKNRSLTRRIQVARYGNPCNEWRAVKKSPQTKWNDLSPHLLEAFPKELQRDLTQIAEKSLVLRPEFDAREFLLNNPIGTYTVETNRELTSKYGNIFSAQVFKAWIESKEENRDFRQTVLEDLRSKLVDIPKRNVTLVVSFGLGWSERYDVFTPDYISDFISDIKSLEMPVVFLEKNPFGSIGGNIQRIVPQLKTELEKGNDLIILSLCKGTPEVLSALSEVLKESPGLDKGQILGHVNLSGMIRGTFFSDIKASSILPKIIQPFMKILPFKSLNESAEMIGALKYVKSTIVEKTILEASHNIPQDIPIINVTGAPMSDRVLQGNSPMKPVLKYNFLMKFLKSANDGFIELPNTVMPEHVSQNQLTLVLDSSHLLADGFIDEQSISDQETRRKLYRSIVKHILRTR